MIVRIDTTRGLSEVDTDALTPTAAAIARLWSANRLHTPGPITLESIRTVREMTPPEQFDEVVAWYGEDALDCPHRMVWPYRPRGGRAHSLAEELERQAAALPIGYRPIGSALVEETDAVLVEDEDYITSAEVLRLMTELGRPIGKATLANYKSNPPQGWPGIARYVGRTPQWSRRGIVAYVTRLEARDLAARALRDRKSPDLRHSDDYPTASGHTLRVKWNSAVEWEDPRRPGQYHTDRGTVVEITQLTGHIGVTDTCRPEGGAPGRYWWALDALTAPRPYRIAIVDDDELAEAVRLLLAAARA